MDCPHIIAPITVTVIIGRAVIALISRLRSVISFRVHGFSVSKAKAVCREVAQKYEPVGRSGACRNERDAAFGGVGGVGEYERGLRR